jgi:hypothetical protein
MFDFDYDQPGALVFNDFLNTLKALEIIDSNFYHVHSAYIQDDYYWNDWELDDEYDNQNT